MKFKDRDSNLIGRIEAIVLENCPEARSLSPDDLKDLVADAGSPTHQLF